MKEVNFNIIKKVKEYPWWYFKRKQVYHIIQIKNDYGFTTINSINLGDFLFEVDDSKLFYERTYQDYCPGYSFKTLTRDKCYLKDLVFTESSFDEYELQITCSILVVTDYDSYGRWKNKSMTRKEVPFVNEMKKFIRIKLNEK